jgi:hypothetical protein
LIRRVALGLAVLAVAAPGSQAAPLGPDSERLAPRAAPARIAQEEPATSGTYGRDRPDARTPSAAATEDDPNWLAAGLGALAIAALTGAVVAGARRRGGLARTT